MDSTFFRTFSRAVSVQRNYLTFFLAGAFVFAGSILLDHFEIKNPLTIVLLIISSAFGANRIRPFSLA
jgi:hypothetical protein